HASAEDDEQRIADLALVDDDGILWIRPDDASRGDHAQRFRCERRERVDGSGLGHVCAFEASRNPNTHRPAWLESRQPCLRKSSMTLPSFGSSPGAWNATSPRSLVTSRMVATIASAAGAGSRASTCRVMRSTPSGLSTMSRAFAIAG